MADTKAEKAVKQEMADLADDQPVQQRWGFSARIQCVNPRCVNYKVDQMARIARMGDVYVVPYFHCAKCLFQMYMVNPLIGEPLGMTEPGDEE